MFQNLKYGDNWMQLLWSWVGFNFLVMIPMAVIIGVLDSPSFNDNAVGIAMCASAGIVFMRNQTKINNYLKNIEEIQKEVPEVIQDFYNKEIPFILPN